MDARQTPSEYARRCHDTMVVLTQTLKGHIVIVSLCSAPNDTYGCRVGGRTNSWHPIQLLTELGGVRCPDWLSTRKFLGQPSVRERWVPVERARIPTEGGYVRVLSPAHLTGVTCTNGGICSYLRIRTERTNVYRFQAGNAGHGHHTR